MLRRTRASRLGWFVAAVLQLLVPTLWSAADAQADAVSARTATVHVEAPGSTHCARVHPADCAVCRVIATAAVPCAAAAVPVSVPQVIEAGPADVARQALSARAPGDPPQRAPPV
jgi:hypothetical protein